jgi:hypothetical protein
MGDTEQRFQSLAEGFKVLAHNLSEGQNPKQRRELLKGMMLVLNEIDNLIANEHSLSDSKPDSTAPSNPPLLSKAAHQ